MKRLLLLVITLVSVQLSFAQLLTWSPPFPKEADASQTLEITLDAAKGNQGLLNYTMAGWDDPYLEQLLATLI